MTGVQIYFPPKSWRVKTPLLTRYLNEKYVSQFFDDGSLRLSSFKAFRKHSDDERGDHWEGWAFQKNKGKDIHGQDSNFGLMTINGSTAYILCAATVENKRLEASFDTTDGFRITNSIAFAECISRHIPGFTDGFEGLCSYRAKITIEKNNQMNMPASPEITDPKTWSEQCNNYAAEQSIDSYFVKHLKYAHQGEYRFIWFASGIQDDFIDIKCPEALKFCQRI